MIQRSALGPVLATLAAVALVGGACGSSATPSPSVAAPASVAPASAPESASPSAAPSLNLGSLLPSIFNSATDLEALLPSTVCAKPTQKFSFNGDAFAAAGSSTDPTFLAVLQALGKTPKDVSFAVATVVDPTCNTTFVAFRIQGVDQGQFEQLYVAESTKNDGTAPTKVSLGGKDVWKSPSSSGNTTT